MAMQIEIESRQINRRNFTHEAELLHINMGPQHPATHGVLRLEVLADGETIVELKPHIGYLHRCMEKHSESVEYRGVVPFVDRLDYLASMNMEWGYVMAVEKLLGLEIPRRAELIRILVCELQRIASHLMAFGTYIIDLGALTPFMLAFQKREEILSIFEKLTGARLLYNYIWIGGVWHDVTAESLKSISLFCDGMEKELKTYSDLVTTNKIFVERTANIGVITAHDVFAYGATGPVLRGSGISWDLRKNRPYSLYPEFDFSIPIGEGRVGKLGDCFDRYDVRMREISESIKIIRQVLEKIQDGPIMAKVPKIIKVPAGEIYQKTECPRGELGFHLITKGDRHPYRLKVKSPCFTHISMIPHIAPGNLLADVVSILGSLDFMLGEVDR